MKVFAVIATSALAALGASGFDSEAWLARCAEHDEAASRMRAAWSNYAARVSAPVQDATCSLALHDDGSPKLVLRAAKAQIFEEKDDVPDRKGRKKNRRLVWAEGVEISMFGEDGSDAGRAEVASCFVDAKTRRGWGEGRVRLVRDSCVLEGEGLYFSHDDGFARIFRNASMRAEGVDLGGKSGGILPGLKGGAKGKKKGDKK